MNFLFSFEIQMFYANCVTKNEKILRANPREHSQLKKKKRIIIIFPTGTTDETVHNFFRRS